jgi:hypothetical protein
MAQVKVRDSVRKGCDPSEGVSCSEVWDGLGWVCVMDRASPFVAESVKWT